MNRDDLKNYYHTQEWINDEIELYKEQKQRAESLRSPVVDGMPKAHNKPNDAIEQLIDKYNEIIEHINKLQDKQNEIVRQLQLMPNATYRRILFLKYIRNTSLEEIAVTMGYEYKHLCKLHGYALIQFEEHEKRGSITTENVVI